MASVVDDVNTTVVNVDSTPPGFDPNANNNNNNNNNNTNDNNTEENAFTQWSATDADKRCQERISKFTKMGIFTEVE